MNKLLTYKALHVVTKIQTYASRFLSLFSMFAAPTETLLPPTTLHQEKDKVKWNWYRMTGTVCLYCYGFLKGPFHQ